MSTITIPGKMVSGLFNKVLAPDLTPTLKSRPAGDEFIPRHCLLRAELLDFIKKGLLRCDRRAVEGIQRVRPIRVAPPLHEGLQVKLFASDSPGDFTRELSLPRATKHLPG
jgi:hypothetical protein